MNMNIHTLCTPFVIQEKGRRRRVGGRRRRGRQRLAEALRPRLRGREAVGRRERQEEVRGHEEEASLTKIFDIPKFL